MKHSTRRAALVVAAVILATLSMMVGLPTAGAAPGVNPGVSHRPVCLPRSVVHFVRCMSDVVTDANGVPVVTASPTTASYGPAQFHTGYKLPKKTPLISGTTTHVKNTIAIVDAYWIPTITSDLAAFDTQYGLPSFATCSKPGSTNCLAILRQDGTTVTSTNHPSEDDAWGLEISLDVQVAHEICQNCRVNLVLANSNSFSDLEAAVAKAAALGSNEISNSYGSFGYACGSAGYDYPGKAVVASAGDSGFGIACPATANTVVSVGGTSLHLSSTNTYVSESVWSGTGSGCSSASSAQPWQTSLPNWSSTGCGTGRAMNDVAADADPATGAAVYDCSYYGSCGWMQVGGTSLAAPLIAAVYGLAGYSGSPSYPASLPYAKRGTSALHDVTAGSDGSCSVAIQCTAGPGYDLPTGVGTPHGTAAF